MSSSYTDHTILPDYAMAEWESGKVTPVNAGRGKPVWSGANPPPEVGAEVATRFLKDTPLIVKSYFEVTDWLGVLCVHKNDESKVEKLFGAEIDPPAHFGVCG